MTRFEQVEFVDDLLSAIRDKVTEKITGKKIPEDWDGAELRQYIADKAKDAAHIPLGRGRKLKYNNSMVIFNL